MTAEIELRFSGDDAAGGPWMVVDARFEDRLNRPYELHLNLETDDDSARAVALLGKTAKLEIQAGNATRVLIGIVSEVSERNVLPPAMAGTEVVLRPALEALRHRRNTRIFQDQSVPDILAAVMSDGLGGYGRSTDVRLNRTYPTCEFRVQYDETDLDFCHRLMEEEGITYYFTFEGDAETLVLSDDDKAYPDILDGSGATQIVYDARRDESAQDGRVHRFDARSRLLSTKLTLRHFDWTRPSTPIEAESEEAYGDPNGSTIAPAREIYEHDAHKPTLHSFDGNAYGGHDAGDQATLRRQESALRARVGEGESTVLAMTAGGLFELHGHPAPEHDVSYLVLESSHSFARDGRHYANTFRCVPSDVPHRPRRVTPRPTIRSMLTATVVGPAGEEIHTDTHGRIKVQFHWDRLGASDDHSSCFLRVMQPWAGKGWGFVFLPRIGMEVVVRFVDGDPDRPVAVGSVYNGANPPPLTLPDQKTKSTIKTASSLGGGGNNELRFEDLAGSEEMYLHAQKDFNEVVEHDHTTTVHNNQSIKVDVDQSQEVGANQTEHVFANQDLTVDANRTVSVHGSFTETIDGSETRTVSSGVTETISAGETRTVSGGMTETISGGRTQSISGGSTETINGSLNQTITGAVSVDTPATYSITATGGITVIAPGGMTIIAPAGHQIVAPGGQRIVDSTWGEGGKDWYDSIASAISVQVLGKLSTKVFYLTASALNVEISAMKYSRTKIELLNTGLDKKKWMAAKLKGLTRPAAAGAHAQTGG